MERIKILMPEDLLNAISMKANIHKTTKSHEAETLLRNGVAIFLKMKEYSEAGNRVGINLCRTILRRGFSGIRELDGGSIRIIGMEVLPANLDERVARITRLHKNMKKVSTTITTTDGLLEYMVRTSGMLGDAPLSFVVFMFLEAALVAWHMRVNIDEESIPKRDREPTLKLLEDLKHTFAEFAYDEYGHLHVFSEKKTRGEEMPVQTAAEIASRSVQNGGGNPRGREPSSRRRASTARREMEGRGLR